MGILDSFLNRRRENVAALQYRSSAGGMVPAWQAGKPQWLPSTVEAHDTHAYRKVALIAACVEYLSHAAGTAPLRVYDPESEEADDTHPLRQMIVQPNPGMGEGRFFSFLAMNMAVTNFVVIEKERGFAGMPVNLWPLRSDWIRPILRNQAEPDWEYRVPGRDPIILEADDVIVITWADTPDQAPTGTGPLSTVLREAQISSALTDFVKVFMDRGAIPLYMLVPSDDPKLAAQFSKPETKEAFLDAFRRRYQGLPTSVDPLLSPGIKDVKRIGLDMNELAYRDLNNMADSRICSRFGVPAVLVGTEGGQENSTYSNGEQAERNFYSGTMPRLWSRIDDAFTRQLLPEFEYRPGWDIRFDTSEIAALQDDVNEAWTRATAAWNAGLISRHVAHVEMGVDPHGVDEIAVPFNVTLLPVATGTAAKRSAIEASVTVHGENTYLRALPTHDPKAPLFVYRDGRRYVNEARLSPAEREQRAAIATTNTGAIDALAGVIAPRLESFFAEQKERVLGVLVSGRGISAENVDHAARFGGKHAVIADQHGFIRGLQTRFAEAIDWASEDDLLRRIFSAWWDSVTETALGNAESLLGMEINWAVANPYIADLTGVLGERIGGINQTTRTQIEDALTALMSEGTTVPEMGEAIESLFEQTYKNRHLTVARTESMVGYAEASTMAYEASGVVDRVQVMDNASHTESYAGAADGLTCAQRNGLVVPLARGSFHVRSDHPNGSASLAPVLTTPLGEV